MFLQLTDSAKANKIRVRFRSAFRSQKLPPRSTAGQLTLDQHIGVRIPGGQPIFTADSPHKRTTNQVLCSYGVRVWHTSPRFYDRWLMAPESAQRVAKSPARVAIPHLSRFASA